MPIKLTLERIEKRFADVKVLDSINMSIEEGEFRVILGPSGIGKTTLLNIISGLLMPDRGKIILDGRDITDTPANKRNIGYIFQDLGLFSTLNIRENIAYGLRIRKIGEKEINRTVKEIAEKFSITDLLNKFPSEISGGQKQLVALARILVVNPSVILMDEPLSSLDTYLRNNMRWYIRGLAKDLGLTVVYVTHDIDDCSIMADNVSVLYGGKMIEEGKKDSLLNDPKTEETARLLGYNIVNFNKRKVFIHPARVKRGGEIKTKIIKEEKGILYHYLLETEFGNIYAVFDTKFNETEGISFFGD